MKYVKIGGGAYQLAANFSIKTIVTGYEVKDDLYELSKNGLLVLKKYFAWDGPTGAKNTRTFIVGSGVHDAFCEMIRKGLLPAHLQCLADEQMDIINSTPQVWTDGEEVKELLMNPFRRFYVYVAVRIFQHRLEDKHQRKTIYVITLQEP